MPVSLPSRVVPLRQGTEPGAGGPDAAELVRRALNGAEAAKAELFRRHARELLALLTRLLGSTSDAEDALQDTFVVAFRDLPKLRDPASVAGWLRQIAVHQAQRRFRRRRLLSVIGMGGGDDDAALEILADPRRR